MDILWTESTTKEFKDNINILYTPIEHNSNKRFKSLLASIKNKDKIQSYILTLVYDKNSNNQEFSGHIFKHDSKGAFIEVYQYQNGDYIQTLKELTTTNKSTNRGCSCSTSVLEVVELIMDGWDVGTLLDCVCVGGTTGGGSSTTYETWSTPSSNIKNPIDWSLGHNDNLGNGAGSSSNNSSSSNNNPNELNLQDIKPWWSEEDKIINELTGKTKCLYEKLLNSSSGFKNMIRKFDSDLPVSHLRFKLSDLPLNINAETSPPKNFVIDIKINQNRLNRPNLSIVRTIIHETIHAEMFRKMISLASNHGSIDVKLLKTMLSNGDYPGMIDYYSRFGVNGFQHQQMASHYTSIIGGFLREFQPGLSEDIYNSLAWTGLKGTIAWNSLSDQEKNKINNTVSNFIKKGSESCI